MDKKLRGQVRGLTGRVNMEAGEGNLEMGFVNIGHCITNLMRDVLKLGLRFS